MELGEYTTEELKQLLSEEMEDSQSFKVRPDSSLMEYSNQELFEMADIPTPEKQPVHAAGGVAGDIIAYQKGLSDIATIGYGDEIKAGIQAGIRAPLDPDVTFQEAYDVFLDKARSQSKAYKEQNPYAYGAGQVTGAFLPTSLSKGQALSTVGRYGRNIAGAAGYGTLYGAGSGEGIGERVTGGVVGGLTGAAGGAAFTAAGDVLRPITKPLTARAVNLYNKTLGKTQKIPERQEIFSKTKGQRTQDPKEQQLEAEALALVHGEEAGRLAQMARTEQSRERQAFLEGFGDIKKPGSEHDIMEEVFETIKSKARSKKAKVNHAYEIAREGGGVKISGNNIKEGLFLGTLDIKRQGQYNLDNMPLASSVTKDLTRLVRKSKGGQFEYQDLKTLEGWRTRVTNSLNSTKDKTEKRFLGQMLGYYDDFMYKTANEAVDAGDESAIYAFRNAVRQRAEYGRLYEKDKFVSDLVSGKKDIDDAVKDLLGTGSIVGKKRMESTYDAIISAAGSDGDLVRADLQAGFVKKLLNQSIEGLEAGGENPYLSAAKMQTALKGLFVNNKSFSEKLFGKENTKAALKAIDELEYIARTQPSTQNPSGSGYAIIRTLNKIPFVRMVSVSFEEAGRSMSAGRLGDNLAEVIQKLPITPQSKFFTAKVGGLTPQIYIENQKNNVGEE